MLLVGSLLHVLDDANKLAGCPVPYTQLANAAVSQAVMQSLQVEWMAWQREKQSVLARGAAGAELPQSLCQLPFLMTPECKKVIMQGEAMLMQNHEVQNSLDRAMALMQRGTVRFHAVATVCFCECGGAVDALESCNAGNWQHAAAAAAAMRAVGTASACNTHARSATSAISCIYTRTEAQGGAEARVALAENVCACAGAHWATHLADRVPPHSSTPLAHPRGRHAAAHDAL